MPIMNIPNVMITLMLTYHMRLAQTSCLAAVLCSAHVGWQLKVQSYLVACKCAAYAPHVHLKVLC